MSEAIWQFAGSAVDHGPYRPVAALIEDQVDRTPDRPAVVHRAATERVLTYAEFDALANGLAAELTAAGVGAGDMVPVVLGNSEELPVCMVALMKIGAVFVLCDPAWPEERLRSVLEVLRPALVLTSGSTVRTELPVHVVSVDGITPTAHRPGLLPGPEEPVYGVFTSGTTGTPKCAVNLHGGLTNRFRFMSRHFRADGEEVVLQNSRHTFDSAIWQLLWPLTTGGRTVVPEPGEFLDLERTVETIDRYRVTITDFVPAILGMLVTLLEADPESVAKVSSLRHLVVGGEEIIPHAVHRLRAMVPGLEVSNGYGPSETSIGMVFHRIDGSEGDRIPLGRPIDNCYAVVTDEDLRPLPPGRSGQILVGGACVGAGYVGDPELTAKLFVPNPFPAVPGERLYRTGDLGWYDEAGLLRFVGRRDRQTKVDGVRIELAEIETTAEGCAGVVQAKALTVRRAGRNRLVIAVAAENTTPAVLRAHLADRLPRVQMPQHCVVLQALPLTDNGKVDLGTLRGLVEEKLGSEAPPAAHHGDALEERVARVLRDVLGLPHFGVHDDFLARGGDSLSALGAAIRMRDELGVRPGLSELYRHRTPAALAAALSGRLPDPGGEAEVAAVMERDAALDATLAELAGAAAGRVADGPPASVLVTGAAGFVGARTVHQLLTATGARVVCPVRGRDDAHARGRVVDALRTQGLWEESFARRLDIRRGDIGEPLFGWTRETWDALAADCDAVLNVAALVNFLLDYRAHRPANVRGAAEVLRFALTGRPKRLHHVSTLGVLDHHAVRCGRPLGEDSGPSDAQAPRSGYSRSKWVAERMLLEARRLGAPVTVLRLGEVMPAADNGVPNRKALTHLLLSAFHRLGLCPSVPMYSDYTPVDFAAERLVCGLLEPDTTAVRHIFRPGSVDFTALGLAAGGPADAFRPVPPAVFMDALAAAAEGERTSEAAVLHALLTALPVDGPDGLPDFGRLLADNPALFTRASCAALEARHGLADRPSADAISAYRRTLGA